MRTFYVVLWMPSVVHTDFNWLYKQQTDIFEISDGLPVESLAQDDLCLYAQISINAQKDFEVFTFKDKEKKQDIQDGNFILRYEEHSHNGLFKYSFDIPDEGNMLIRIKDDGSAVFPCDIYNHMKEFYHRHNYHALDDGDSIIKPFVTAENIDIKVENNAALRHYLCEYDKKFTYSFHFLSLLYDQLILKKRWVVYMQLMFGKGKHGPFYQIATTIKGDKTYCNTLLNSYYNRFVKVESAPDASPEEKTRVQKDIKEARRREFNIENITQSVAIMGERVNNRFSLSTSVISFWLACFAIVLSVLFFCFTK
ncbi:MAG: hypothetical protein J1E57_07545 [Prevotella sp.]|nr:hypothetical protein [Prevotella sp.]